MNNDLIKRNLAISYAASGLIRRIDGEEWIRISEVKQSLNDVPKEPQDCSDCKRYVSPYFEVKFDKEQMKELVDKAKEEVLASIDIQQAEWIPVTERLPEDMQKVLIWFEYYRYGDFNCMYQTYGFGYVLDGKWSPFINGKTGWQDYNIIAWMPLPEPYEVGGDENG